ncbi:hypothetical protein D9M73_279390 [compost metagenome]
MARNRAHIAVSLNGARKGEVTLVAIMLAPSGKKRRSGSDMSVYSVWAKGNRPANTKATSARQRTRRLRRSRRCSVRGMLAAGSMAILMKHFPWAARPWPHHWPVPRSG